MEKVGVLALQGAFQEHIDVLHQLGVDPPAIRLPSDLQGLDGLVIPGGESSTMTRLMEEYDLSAPLKRLVGQGLPTMGTCAGMVLLAHHVSGMDAATLGAIDMDVRRNAFGRQVDSFETDIDIPALGGPSFHAVFIRAPYIERVGDEVEVLAQLPDGVPVAAKQRNALALAFHPELTPDARLHNYFLDIVRGKR